MLKKLVALLALIPLSVGLLVACGHRYASCAGADTLDTITISLVARGGGGAPSSSGARSGGSSSGGARSGGGAPANSGARPGGAPANSGARAAGSPSPAVSSGRNGAPTFSGARPGGQVPSYNVPKGSIGKVYAINGRVYSYHPQSYWNQYPLDPYNIYDRRNGANRYSPYYGEHIMVACR